MKILVLGGSGFLGSHVADQLTLTGHHVHIFDRMPSPWIRQDQKMIVGDLLDQATLDQANVEMSAFFLLCINRPRDNFHGTSAATSMMAIRK